MSKSRRSEPAARGRRYALAFAALGDETRLALIGRLARESPCSIKQLTDGSRLTRQAVTKHLRVLESAGLVHCRRNGRERLFEFESEPLDEMQQYLRSVSAQWDEALARLKLFVEA